MRSIKNGQLKEPTLFHFLGLSDPSGLFELKGLGEVQAHTVIFGLDHHRQVLVGLDHRVVAGHRVGAVGGRVHLKDPPAAV